MIKYCLPIIKETKEEVLDQISQNPDYDFYEIWLAYISDLDTDFIWKISEEFNGKLIFLFRRQNLEKSEIDKRSLRSGDLKELKEKIIKLLENSNNYLDLDINDQKQELDFVKNNKLANKQSLALRVKIIVSYHNYKETPDLTELERICKNMEEYSPEIFKVSTFCKTPEDALKLLNLTLVIKNENKKFIVLGMGDEGKIVRIYSALWGNELNFAPVNEKEKSAPGQMTREKLERILSLLKGLDSGSSPE